MVKLFLIIWALISYSAAEREYFHQSINLTWDEARSHCQACFKDLVTVTAQNTENIAEKIPTDSWIGLRKNFNFTSDSNGDSNFTDESTSNTTSSILMLWSRWANGDPLSFQNWYPGWPVFKKPPPKRDCCSCSCTCPATATPGMTTAAYFTDFTTRGVTSSGRVEENTEENVTDMSSFTNSSTDLTMTDVYGVSFYDTENETLSNNFTNIPERNTPVFTTSPPTRTSMPPIESECVRSPMLTPDIPDYDENYIEDSCVAVLSSGAWIEKECSELLPFICYEDRFSGKVDVTDVTTTSAVLNWLPGPGDISDYRVEVNGQMVTMESPTNLTFDLVDLTGGTRYSVQVFAVKCDRDLNPQKVDFYTTPNKVRNLEAANMTETSLFLSWDKPDGNAALYVVKWQGKESETSTEGVEVDGLIPGSLYTFTVLAGVEDKSKRILSEKSRISQYTRPGTVSNLKASENTNTSLLLSWEPPKGNSSSFSVKATNSDSDEVLWDEVVKATEVRVTKLPHGTEITLSVRALANDTLEGEEVTIHTYTTPEPISNLILETTESSLTATWNSPRSKYLFFNIRLQFNGSDVGMIKNLTEPRETFEGLKTAANYTVTVWAVSGHVKSPPVTRSNFTLPLPPNGLEVTAAEKDKITFKWDAPANTASSTYLVKISSNFWDERSSATVENQASYTFEGLRPGTSYNIEVQTVADGKVSLPDSVSYFTVAETREISLSMMCSSAEILLCNETTTRESVFRQLKAHFERELGTEVFWELEI